jgi:hypothetical protein
MRIKELEREIVAAGVKYTRSWEPVDRNVNHTKLDYRNVGRVDGEIVAEDWCMGEYEQALDQWWEDRRHGNQLSPA